MLDELHQAVPGLDNALSQSPFITDAAFAWRSLRRLLLANAPSGGAGLPGAIVDDISTLADGLNLAERLTVQIGSTGNAGLAFGTDKPAADVIIVAHMDRPSFRVRLLERGELYPICANRFPTGVTEAPAKALRFQGGRLIISAEGRLVSERHDGVDTLVFQVSSGSLSWQDTVTIQVEPVLDGDQVTGTGLDNCLGVVTALGAAVILLQVEESLRAAHRRCLVVFSDLEEGLPESFFGHGAARLAYAVPPPTFGCIVVDAHTVNADGAPQMGQGASHGIVSGWGRGAMVPPNCLALAVDLAAEVNAAWPGTVQMNTGYLSRSDDMALGRWTQILGMIGPPMRDAHSDHETAYLSDVAKSIRWLTCFVMASMGISAGIAKRYALVR